MAVEIGSKVTGKVTGITNFGAFVDLGSGQSGLVHISEVSNQYVKDIHDVLTVGDTVTVKVVSQQNGKIGLSIKQASDAPASVPVHGKPSHSGEHRHFDHHDHHETDNYKRNNSGNHNSSSSNHHQDFDSMLSGFLKDSEDRLTDIKRNTEGKRGGRGGRRG